MLWVHNQCICNSFSAGIVIRRQILTPNDDPRAERINLRFREKKLYRRLGAKWSYLTLARVADRII